MKSISAVPSKNSPVRGGKTVIQSADCLLCLAAHGAFFYSFYLNVMLHKKEAKNPAAVSACGSAPSLEGRRVINKRSKAHSLDKEEKAKLCQTCQQIADELRLLSLSLPKTAGTK